MGVQDKLKHLPQVGELLDSDRGQAFVAGFGHEEVRRAARWAIDAARALILGKVGAGGPTAPADFADDAELLFECVLDAVERCLEERTQPSQCRVLNATGVILHTSLGRAVLSRSAWEAAGEVAKGYSLLELQRDSGKRGDRDEHVNGMLRELTGAEAATVCNNNAAATWLILNELCEGKEVVVSRAHMVEIGGSYRMPEVMKRSGAKMVEVGATNKCRVADYEEGLSENTGCILKVHTSNYRIDGFVEYASLQELVALGRRRGVPVVFDLGAGSLVDLRPFGLSDEPEVPELVRQGADLVSFSGDKLLGGPQAGICVGRKDLIQRLKKNQMFRMLRCDKVTLALLEATLRAYRNPATVWEEIPTLRMISEALGVVQARAEQVMLALSEVTGVDCELVKHEAFVGGGSLPTERVPSYAVKVAVAGYSAENLGTALRRGTPSVFGRILNDALLLDCRTISDGDIGELALAFTRLEREIG